jgi:formylglycine-generating enzyme required for sulfatase activity
MPALGSIIGSWRVEAFVGRGGMAEVWRVRHTSLDSARALKILHVGSPEFGERVLREGRIQARIVHRNVVSVLDILEVDGRPALVMELVAGPSLEQRLSAGPIPADEADRIFAAVLDGVEAAHALGAVHRDLKPANILLDCGGGVMVPRITDFGLAKVVAESSAANATKSGMMAGTPAYMSPEQWRDAKRVDERTDIFALGCILYELRVGGQAFPQDNVPDLLAAVLGGRHAPIPDTCPPALRDTIERCLEVDRDRRVACVAEIRALLGGNPVARSLPAPAQSTLRPVPGAARTWHEDAIGGVHNAGASSPRGRALAVIAGLLLLGGGLAVACGISALGYIGGLGTRSTPVDGGPTVAEPGPGTASSPPPASGSPAPATSTAPRDPAALPAITLDAYESPIGMRFLKVEKGTFIMGSPETADWRDDDEVEHEVRLTRDYWLATTEVTQAAWEDLVGTNPSRFLGDPARPVESVSWHDAVAFANRLSALEGLIPAYKVDGTSVQWDRGASGYRLPTEAEWEYAARAGGDGQYHGFGSEAATCWHKINGVAASHPVGRKDPNAWGFHDLGGNVQEWVWDLAAPYAGPSVDPAGPTDRNTGTRLVRGGSYAGGPELCRATYRDASPAAWRHETRGFRLARTAEE